MTKEMNVVLEILRDVQREQTRLDAKMDVLISLLNRRSSSSDATPTSESRPSVLARLTTKQHATLQMLHGGHSNQDIADRFGVSVNTAKVYVRSLAANLGVNSRNQITTATFKALNEISDEDYLSLTGGLPKTWEKDFTSVEADKYRDLYAKRKDS